VWTEFVELLDELVDLLGDEQLSASEFGETILTMLAQFDLAITPPTVDQVIVGDVERTRYDHFDGVVLIGLNEGEFPRVAREPTVLGDAERGELAKRAYALESDTGRRLLDESLLAYLGMTRARRRLCVTRHTADDDGREANPSPFWREITSLIPSALKQGEEFAPAPTPRTVISDLADWARGFSAENHRAALYHAIVTNNDEADPARRLMKLAWPALTYANAASLSSNTIQNLFASQLDASVSQIETFAACPYKHFARSTLGLKLRPEPDLTVLDMGTLFHSVLERLVSDQIRRSVRWNQGNCPPKDAIRAATLSAGEALRGQMMLSTGRNQYLLRTIEQTVEEVMARQHECGSAGTLAPSQCELGFGLPAEDDQSVVLSALELTTPRNRRVRLRGKVDRVDCCVESDAVAVFDYKSTQDQLNLAHVHLGLSLQLVTYLLVLEANGHALAGKKLTPAAAFYVRLLRTIERVSHPDDEVKPAKMRGVFDASKLKSIDANAAETYKSDFLSLGITQTGELYANRSGDATTTDEFAAILSYVRRHVVELVDRIMDGEITVRPYRLGDVTPCPLCDYRPLCRFETPLNRYMTLPVLSRPEVLSKIAKQAAEAGR
jgi:ATP-dependent helicase/nuclease subunit B